MQREVVAGSHELGQDYEHVTLLVERFKEFAKETDSIGSERVPAVNEIADSLISVGHTDAATIAQWKDSLNDAWADLGELIDTRNQMLEASRALHKYFNDCKDVLSRILEKQNSMSDELGRDGASVSMLQKYTKISFKIFQPYSPRLRLSRKIAQNSRQHMLEKRLWKSPTEKER